MLTPQQGAQAACVQGGFVRLVIVFSTEAPAASTAHGLVLRNSPRTTQRRDRTDQRKQDPCTGKEEKWILVARNEGTVF